MSFTTDFVIELCRTGNQAGKLTPFEARRLLERSTIAIREMVKAAPADALPHRFDERLAIIEDFAKNIAGLPPQLLAHALLDAADILRVLNIVQDAKAEMTTERGDP